ncbi:imidazole glycerol phosphate synthase subunit HisH [Cyanobium sp. Morenito 9A2]|uniref:imidazole glycerol phosphate synthase subunit HisH n=1 Tax=Cyanobium sp. Morenito 9A2 TaxID=2823718 RepID=UPI0020CF5DDC|nr:imidazole glycerol phosphate synthase subunit HisH [Cyanobium sp. Morenito 9A2]MCP9850730.1 imidazole glycerol phosphate synthase subunit HisH [Cyanobium sp. Morenito 9A2]
MSRIGLIDYGMGNLHSVTRAFERLGAEVVLLQRPGAFADCQALVLPGVGAFDPAMERLQGSGLVPALEAWTRAGRPLLGICLGLQLLFEGSDEGQSKGLGLIKGRVRALPRSPGHPVPHMGWAPLIPATPSPLITAESPSWVYFVHSYAADPSDPACITARVAFGATEVAAAIWAGPIAACQFHPEKSSSDGQALLRRWLAWVERPAALVR